MDAQGSGGLSITAEAGQPRVGDDLGAAMPVLCYGDFPDFWALLVVPSLFLLQVSGRV